MLMKVLSHPGHGNSDSCLVGNWTCFTSHPQGFFRSLRECPYRVVGATYGSLTQTAFMLVARTR